MIMHSLKRLALAAGLALGAVVAAPAADAAGLMTPKDGTPALDLRDQAVDVVVGGGYAVVTVEQTFANPNAEDMEAIYSFPVPERAAVSEFTYWIDGKPVTAEVMEKEEARNIYEGEKAAGRETALAEQDAYKTFDMTVWPVRAGSDVKIRLAYIQPAKLDTGIGRFVYPLEEGGVDDNKLAFWTANETVTGSFSFDLHLRTDYTVEALRLPAHPGAAISKDLDGSWRVHIDNATAAPNAGSEAVEDAAPADEDKPASTPAQAKQNFKLDTDIVVYWRQAENEPARVDMLAYKPESDGRGTFMLTLTPGMDLKPITEGRDFIFVLDRSGSMGGKMSSLTEGVSRALGQLNPDDRFRIVYFNDSAKELTRGFMNASQESISKALEWVRSVDASGGTNLYDGLKLGLDAADADRTSALVLVTDGVANVGRTEVKDFLALVKEQDVRLFTAIMGNSVNRPLLEPMTLESGGFASAVSNSDDIIGVLLQATTKVTHEALHGVKLDLDPSGSDLTIDDLRRKGIRTLYRGEQMVLFGHYRGAGEADLTLSGEISGKPVSYKTRFAFPETVNLNPELERLWAFAEIERELRKLDLLGSDADVKQSVIDTSKEYGILSPFTSMLVVRDERFEELAIDRTNRDRLAVEDTARQKRMNTPAQTTRVDTQTPMFDAPRPSHSGGGSGGSGAIGLPGLILAILVLCGTLRLRRREAA
ncbi:Ca-activated chloride channel family protein [Rhodopseudomonas julia]|uniref:Ca-activated chloride channel family protein n=1 Tax=Rhodopseudomonas julia TaxID=200617 RepID=A0ABU0CAR4_9BRAD|nr:VIT domain-containing protein [Rhodopseudomonas julia]MDQ0326690.1 Ca-activated chloride channel family protein [Rhodopseudomonas julia]